MPIICEKVPPSEIVEKSAYKSVKDFVLVSRSERPKDIRVAEKWCMEPCYLPCYYKDIADRIENFEVRPDDIWVMSYPKCGTTWTQEMVWQILHDFDYETAKKVILKKRFPFMEFRSTFSPDVNLPDEIAVLEAMPSPRTIKTHLPAHLLPKQIWTVKPKIVYVARNAKDTAVSFYHHYRNLQHYPGNFDDFILAFLNDSVIFSPYHSHIIDFWHMRNEENIFFLTFEDMKRDHPPVIKKTAKFLGKTITEDQILELADHLSFVKFSKNRSVNMQDYLEYYEKVFGAKMPDKKYNFVRKGVVGGFREEMSPDIIEKFNKWSEDEVKKWNCDPELRQIFILLEK